MRIKSFIFSLFLVLGTVVPGFAGIPERPDPPRLVNDFAGIFTPAQVAELESMLVSFDDSTSNQITVVTVNDLEGYAPAEYAVKIGLSWGVGNKDFDNGIVVLVVPKTESARGQVSIQVGYGLEGAIPDAYARRIIEQDFIPHFRNDDYYGGVKAGCGTLMKLANGEISEVRERSSDSEELASVMAKILIFMFILYIIIRVIGRHSGDDDFTGGGGNRGRHVHVGPIVTWGGGFGGGHGGFGGGGFGGFGGGSFGGGGASGSW